MTIYTRYGDGGETSLYGGKRVLKSDYQVEAYGTIDELTSFIGLAVSKIKNRRHKNFLISIQKDLYIIMSFLSGKNTDLGFLEKKINNIENKIDELDKKLPKLNKFIIPVGDEVSSWFHILRTVCRRSERAVVKCFFNHQPLTTNQQPLITKYLNRLSDLFFVFARFYNKKETFFCI